MWLPQWLPVWRRPLALHPVTSRTLWQKPELPTIRVAKETGMGDSVCGGLALTGGRWAQATGGLESGGGGDKNMDQTLSSGPKSRRLYIDKPDWRQVA